jgi:quercetin dioxygenase-like cupin family protein
MSDVLAKPEEREKIEQPWGSLRWLFDGERTPGTQMTLGVVEIAPGETNPRHFHDCEEVLYLLEGELLHAVGAEWVRMRAGDAIRLPKGTPHQARNTGAVTARMIVAYDAPFRGFTVVPDEAGS